MKTKTSIYHRTLAFSYVLLAVVFLSSCKDTSVNYLQNENSKIGAYQITVIDNCEYIVSSYDRSRSLTHKGNCKFCLARSVK
jgi:NADH:ubiquinone oxidoreductase subunit F (NADH-binding)